MNHSILFVPVCGKCGERITTTVSCGSKREEFENPHGLLFGRNEIEPPACTKCGTYFRTIKIPGALPFYGYGCFMTEED